MNSRPILFSAPMVRALLNGTKTQSRRIAPVSSLLIENIGDGMLSWHVAFSKPIKGVLGSFSGGEFSESQARSIIASQFCRYGKVGDKLWVRETWAHGIHALSAKRDEDGPFVYAATDNAQHRLGDRWKPSIHMPRAASRITLEITAVRLERLQDISEADAQAEGGYTDPACPAYEAYEALWEEINGSGTWAINPWVWVIEFKVVKP